MLKLFSGLISIDKNLSVFTISIFKIQSNVKSNAKIGRVKKALLVWAQ
jgi:hypothetical protein